MASQEFSIPALAARVTTEADAYRLLEDLRWNGQPEACPKCGGVGRCFFLNPDNGVSRKTRTGAASQRRVWKCGHCRQQFSVLTGTIFHGTKIPVKTWLFVIFEMCSSKNGVSAREIERKYDLTAKSAWFMLHRIREAMKRDPLAGLLSGTVVADETWIGGNPKNRHGSGPGTGKTDKQPVMSLVDYETREVRSRAVADVTAGTLSAVIADEINMPRTQLWTDGSPSYVQVGRQMSSHKSVDHTSGEYVREGAGTNLAEGYFAQLKRSVDGTHHRVSRIHLDRYLAQFDFLYSYCRATDSQRMRRLLSQVDGRRLTYKPLIGAAWS
jgi:transposase-like protein